MLKRTLLLNLTICAAASLAIFQPAYAQLNEFKITASDGAADDDFGLSVSISDDYAVVGAVAADGFAGSAYVFKRSGASWQQESKLLASDGAGGDFFGASVSISGDYAVVGAEGNDDNDDDSGSAYVFKRTGTSWTEEAKLLASDGAANDLFGWSVSISGDYTLIGAKWDDDNGSKSGSAYLFKRTGTSWTEEAKLLASDGAVEDLFGESVSVSGDYTIVGAYWDDDNGSKSGSAYLFKRTGTSWAEEAKLLASDGAADDRFGGSVSISGDYAVVGATGDDDNDDESGSVYVYNGFTSPVGIESERAGIPTEFSLSQNYPNPFNPVTTIRYDLPAQSNVKITIYDLLGRQVKTLVNGVEEPGYISLVWDTTNKFGKQVSAGMYFYQIKVEDPDEIGSGDFTKTRKMVLIK